MWHKKLEKEGKKEFETAEIEKIQKRQMMDNKVLHIINFLKFFIHDFSLQIFNVVSVIILLS